MTKLTGGTLIACLLLSTAACGGTAADSKESAQPVSSTAVPSSSQSASDQRRRDEGATRAAQPTVTGSALPGTPSGAAASAQATSSEPSASVSGVSPGASSVKVSTVPPASIGAYTDGRHQSTDLAAGRASQRTYQSKDGRSAMWLNTTSSASYDEMVGRFQGTGKPLDAVATCGLLYGNKSIPGCMVRLEDGRTLSIAGDSDDTVDQTRAFTTAFLATAKTK